MPCGCGPNSCQDFDDDREGVGEEDLARFGGDDATCPSCKASVYHDVPLCPKCGHAMTDESTTNQRPTKIAVPTVAGLLLLSFVVIYLVWLR